MRRRSPHDIAARVEAERAKVNPQKLRRKGSAGRPETVFTAACRRVAVRLGMKQGSVLCAVRMAKLLRAAGRAS